MVDHQEHRHDTKQHEEATRKRLADEKAHREKQQAAAREASANVKPTPTQQENDLAASGVKVDLEPDGSPEQPPPPDPPPVEGGVTRSRQVEADRNRQGYSTRAQQPADSTKT
ncbi:hypothetical protein [Bradyrhizobium cytisi]|uniref:Uncharacterized protein n=1 Tax=Bradyrhizobium cytisi TaxID=515489 RepID=A0A5S4XDA7_9BRAD|nr:hypothetical protein [Bradyrhizobium cytisi]TYL87428.1 hypothetical protein FXB38_04740 [Bradyrhizobium cytisi]